MNTNSFVDHSSRCKTKVIKYNDITWKKCNRERRRWKIWVNCTTLKKNRPIYFGIPWKWICNKCWIEPKYNKFRNHLNPGSKNGTVNHSIFKPCSILYRKSALLSIVKETIKLLNHNCIRYHCKNAHILSLSSATFHIFILHKSDHIWKREEQQKICQSKNRTQLD